jgi:hypothetical protein
MLTGTHEIGDSTHRAGEGDHKLSLLVMGHGQVQSTVLGSSMQQAV